MVIFDSVSICRDNNDLKNAGNKKSLMENKIQVVDKKLIENIQI